MHFCDFNTLLNIIPTYNTDDYILSSGLSNTIFEINYDNSPIYIACLRGIDITLGANQVLQSSNKCFSAYYKAKLYKTYYCNTYRKCINVHISCYDCIILDFELKQYGLITY